MKTTKEICPMCDEGVLNSLDRRETLNYKGNEVILDLEYSDCPVCGMELVTPPQSKRNESVFRDFKRKVDGLLTGAEIYSARKKLSLTQEIAAKIFGGGPNSFSKYERGEVVQSVAMDKLIRKAVVIPSLFVSLKKDAGIQEKNSLVIRICDYESPCELINIPIQQGRLLPEKISSLEKKTLIGKPSIWKNDDNFENDVAYG
jgi:HTH-type transcriptional regulator/antitoxin MqsA